MPRTTAVVLALATLSAAAYAQNADPAGPGSSSTLSSSNTQSAPVVRGTPGARAVTSTEPIGGVWLLSEPSSEVKTLSADAHGTELRVERGRVNVQVHHPAANSQILIDLPGGQTTILKDGVYTFNAETNTIRVLKGEAEAFAGDKNATVKPVKIKEDHELVLATGAVGLKAREVDPQIAFSDVLQTGPRGEGSPGGGYYAPASGGFGDGFYGSPYEAYGWGSPYGYGYPYGFGSPFGYGLGFGVGFGGYYGGGFRGGYRGGYRGGGRR